MLIVGLDLFSCQEKCFVIEAEFRNEAAFTLSNMNIATRAVPSQCGVAKLLAKTSSK